MRARARALGGASERAAPQRAACPAARPACVRMRGGADEGRCDGEATRARWRAAPPAAQLRAGAGGRHGAREVAAHPRLAQRRGQPARGCGAVRLRGCATAGLRGRVGGRLVRRRSCGPGQWGDMEPVELLSRYHFSICDCVLANSGTS